MTENLEELIFRLPARFEGTPEADIYQQTLERLRQEASGLPMNTVQKLLMERIAANYVYAREAEASENVSTQKIKEFNQFWLSMTQQFNAMLVTSGDRYRDALLTEIANILTESLDIVSDPEERKTLRRTLGERFAEIGV